jgi:hypothetical protein
MSVVNLHHCRCFTIPAPRSVRFRPQADFRAVATSASVPAYPHLRGGKCGDGVRGGFAANTTQRFEVWGAAPTTLHQPCLGRKARTLHQHTMRLAAHHRV